jgi:hypothetical protein
VLAKVTTIEKFSWLHSGRLQSSLRRRIWPLVAILAITGTYTATVTPGHAFVMDDFGAYVMHAANLSAGRRYIDIHYVFNPDAIYLAPAHGYPPVYPMLLSPVYKLSGLSLRPLKIITVLCFAVFLVAFSLLFEETIQEWAIAVLIVLSGLNIAFWEQRDYLMSEFPYLMFSFCALLAAKKIYQTLDSRSWRFRDALLLSLLLYATYGTRTIGVVMLPALIAADIWKFRRLSRFSIVVIIFTLSFIFLQNILIASPKDYISAVSFSARSVWVHLAFYGKTLSYAWRNGYSKAFQIGFALLFITLAGIGFLKRCLTRKSLVEFYLLGYVAVLISWVSEIGMRGLLPIMPLYFAFGLEAFVSLTKTLERRKRIVLTVCLLAFIGITYLGAFRWSAKQEHLLDVGDPEAQELFAYVKQFTKPADLIVFQKPRSLALFTDRYTTMLAPGEPPDQSRRFLSKTNARFLIQSESMSYPIKELIANKTIYGKPVFQNAVFQVYLIIATP